MLEALKEIVSKSTGKSIDELSISEETRIIEDLNLDSITVVGMLFLCEERFQVDITSQGEKLNDIQTVRQLIDLISNLSAKN